MWRCPCSILIMHIDVDVHFRFVFGAHVCVHAHVLITGCHWNGVHCVHVPVLMARRKKRYLTGNLTLLKWWPDQICTELPSGFDQRNLIKFHFLKLHSSCSWHRPGKCDERTWKLFIPWCGKLNLKNITTISTVQINCWETFQKTVLLDEK